MDFHMEQSFDISSVLKLQNDLNEWLSDKHLVDSTTQCDNLLHTRRVEHLSNSSSLLNESFFENCKPKEVFPDTVPLDLFEDSPVKCTNNEQMQTKLMPSLEILNDVNEGILLENSRGSTKNISCTGSDSIGNLKECDSNLAKEFEMVLEEYISKQSAESNSSVPLTTTKNDLISYNTNINPEPIQQNGLCNEQLNNKSVFNPCRTILRNTNKLIKINSKMGADIIRVNKVEHRSPVLNTLENNIKSDLQNHLICNDTKSNLQSQLIYNNSKSNLQNHFIYHGKDPTNNNMAVLKQSAENIVVSKRPSARNIALSNNNQMNDDHLFRNVINISSNQNTKIRCTNRKRLINMATETFPARKKLSKMQKSSRNKVVENSFVMPEVNVIHAGPKSNEFKFCPNTVVKKKVTNNADARIEATDIFSLLDQFEAHCDKDNRINCDEENTINDDNRAPVEYNVSRSENLVLRADNFHLHDHDYCIPFKNSFSSQSASLPLNDISQLLDLSYSQEVEISSEATASVPSLEKIDQTLEKRKVTLEEYKQRRGLDTDIPDLFDIEIIQPYTEEVTDVTMVDNITSASDSLVNKSDSYLSSDNIKNASDNKNVSDYKNASNIKNVSDINCLNSPTTTCEISSSEIATNRNASVTTDSGLHMVYPANCNKMDSLGITDCNVALTNIVSQLRTNVAYSPSDEYSQLSELSEHSSTTSGIFSCKSLSISSCASSPISDLVKKEINNFSNESFSEFQIPITEGENAKCGKKVLKQSPFALNLELLQNEDGEKSYKRRKKQKSHSDRSYSFSPSPDRKSGDLHYDYKHSKRKSRKDCDKSNRRRASSNKYVTGSDSYLNNWNYKRKRDYSSSSLASVISYSNSFNGKSYSSSCSPDLDSARCDSSRSNTKVKQYLNGMQDYLHSRKWNPIDYYRNGVQYYPLYESAYHYPNVQFNNRYNYGIGMIPNKERRVLYVNKIEEGLKKEDFRKRFEKFGLVQNISLHFRDNGDNYGFVTYYCTEDVFNAMKHGNDDPNLVKYTYGIGGRREFCARQYRDLDYAPSTVAGEYCDSDYFADSSTIPYTHTEQDSYDSLLKQFQLDIMNRKHS